MNNTVKKNYYYNLIYQIVAIVVPILITPYISRTIGASGIGYYSYSKSLATYFILLAELSIEIYGQREIAFCNNDIQKRSVVFTELLILRMSTTLLASACYIVFMGFYDGLLKTLLLIQLIDVVSVSIEINWLLRGVENFRAILIRNLMVKALYIAGIVLLVKNPEDLLLYVAICSVSLTAANLSAWISAKKYLVKVKLSDLNIRRHFLPLFLIFIPTIALNLYHLIDKTMLGSLLGDTVESGNYEQGLRLITIATTVITSFGTVMGPRVSSLYAENKADDIKKSIRGAFDVMWLFALPMACGLYLTSDMIVPWFFGAGFEKVADLLKVFAFIVVPIGIKGVFGTQYLVATNRQNKYTFAIVIGLVVNVILNVMFIPAMKAAGATLASVASEVVVVLVLFFVVRNEFGMADAFSGFGKKGIAALVMSVAVKYMAGYFEAEILDTLLVIGFAGVVYGASLLVLRDKTTLSLIRRRSE